MSCLNLALILLITAFYYVDSLGLNKRGCVLLTVICKRDIECLDEDVFLNRCLRRYGLTNIQDTKGDILIREWGEKTSPYISKYIQDTSSTYTKKFDKISEDVGNIHNQQLKQAFNNLVNEINKRIEKKEKIKESYRAYQRESLRESLYYLKQQFEADSNNLDKNYLEIIPNKDTDYLNKKDHPSNDTFGTVNSILGLLKNSKYINNKRTEENDHKEEELVSNDNSKNLLNQNIKNLKVKSEGKKSNLQENNNFDKKSLINPKILLSKEKDILRTEDREEEAIPEVEEEEGERLERRNEIKQGSSEIKGYLIIHTKQGLDEDVAKDIGDKLQESLWKVNVKDHKIFELQNVLNNSAKYLMVVNPTWFESVDDVASVALKLNSDPTIRENIKESTGVNLLQSNSIQISDLPISSKVIHTEDKRWSRLTLGTAIVGGCTLALVVVALVIYALKRRSLDSPVNFKKHEAVQDYQELCRTQMSVVGNAGENETENDGVMKGSWTEDTFPYNMDITTGHVILSYMEDHLKNENRLNKEWEELCSYKADDVSTKCGSEAKNMNKNRYKDVLPFDHTRVKLREVSNMFHSDYINANFITDINPRQPEYIATQGPLDNTVSDFWQMVWEEGVVVIVNLTKLSDMGLPQCHRYWPDGGSEVYHIYEVHLISEHIWCDDYLIRSLYLKNLQTTETRTITQFHYLTWPDLNIPCQVKPLLEFRRKVNKCYRGQACPIVVHCNNGVGRTGTYLLLDMVLNKMIKGAKEIDIAATLEHIRDQRPDMVKTKGQFEFALTAVAEEVTSILSAVPK